MRIGISIAIALLGTLSACSAPPGPYPSLAPRAAEAIDPRVPLPSEVQIGPADANLSAHLAALIDHAQAGDSQFEAAAANAERGTGRGALAVDPVAGSYSSSVDKTILIPLP